MRKTILIVLVLLLCLLRFNLKNCFAQTIPEESGSSVMRTFEVASPLNSTCYAGSVTLNASICSIANSIYSCKILYSLDGRVNVSLSLSSKFIPVECTRIYANGTTEKAPSMFSYYRYNGIKDLSNLPQGNHTLEVYGIFNRMAESNPVWPKLYCYMEIVVFTVNLNQSPKIQNLTIENKTYTQATLPLNFTLENPADWTGYSLDNADNTTITGNTTLSNLPSGTHKLAVYANDTLGNMGKTEATFIIEKETPQTGAAEATSYLLFTGITVGLIIVTVLIIKKLKKP
jgi:hypothetical protein